MFWSVTLSLLEGFGKSFELFALTLLFALPLGLVVSFGSMSRFTPLRLVTSFIVWIIRGTPLMLQLLIIFYGPGLLWDGSLLPRFTAALIGFVVNYACYFSESIPRGQYEAGQVLGMTRTQIFFKVTLLQVIKRVIPPLGNETITLIKDTALARVISVYEIIWNGQAFIKSEGIIWPLFYTAVFYLVFNGLLTILFGYIERRLDYFK